MALVAEKLGTPLMPWQRQVVDTALELDPATGRLAYREVGLTVPRQSGKTTLILALAVHRALLMDGPQRIVYTAQTRSDARKKWEDDHLPILQGSPFGAFFHPRKSAGNEAFVWANGSLHGIMSVTKKSGHGPTVDLAFIDEAFAQEDARLEQATKPSMITRPSPQFWVVSTAGDLSSAFLRAKVGAGRRRVESGRSRTVAYFEWSAPQDADPADEAIWQACMPALGRTVPLDAIRADYDSMVSQGNLAEFRRAYLNQWLDEVPAEWLVIPRETWMGLRASPVAHGQVALAADVSPRVPGRDVHATIVASWRRPDGLTDVEVIQHGRGTAWLPGRLMELVRKWRPCATVIDAVGPAASLVDEIEGLGVVVVRPNTREVVQACGRFYDAVMDSGTVRHGGNPDLDAAVAGAIKRDLGDGWAWDRKGNDTVITPLVACTLASWAHEKFGKRAAPYNLLRSVS